MKIGRVILSLALACFAGTALAQEPTCTFYKVDTSTLPISKDAGGDRYIDALFDGDVACVTRKENIKGVDWGFVAGKLESPNQATPVNGWSPLQRLQQISATEAAALLAGAAAPAKAPSASAAPPAAAAPKAPAVPAPSATAPQAAPKAPATAAAHPEDILRFDQPIPFGPFPVNGHSIKEMIQEVPMFSPVEGLDEKLWKKKCTSCHQWNKDRLCQQALSYVRAPKNVLRVQHPFGGTLKVALMRWARSGCD
jgi:hypothetical protein